MKSTSLFVAASLALAVQGSHAGGFVELPTKAPLPIATRANQATDPLYLATPSLTLLKTTTSPVLFGSVQVGSFIDSVFRDTTDQKLVFGSRLTLLNTVGGTLNQAEINDMFRSGFTGYSAAAAWTFDLQTDRMPTFVARTANGLKQGLAFSPDVVDFRTDINRSELNPTSALYLIKTNANSYTFASNAIRLREGGEEGQPVIQAIFGGYVPATITIPAPPTPTIPEPSSWALMLAGLGLAAASIGRKRMRR